jgi:hypothetical protein
MNRQQLEAALRRAENDGDDKSAEELSVLLAPYVEAQCDAADRDPKAITPAWSELA